MSTTINNSNAQLNYDLGNLKTDAKEVAYIKKQADAAPNHQVTTQMAQQLHTAQQNYATNLHAVTVDLAAGHLSSAAKAHTADFVNALTNGVQDQTQGLESGNNLDSILQQMGDSAGNLHTRQSQITAANANILNVANKQAPNSDMSNAGAEQAAQNLTAGINAQSMEPYAAGHQAAPSHTYDVYDPATPGNSVQNPASGLGPLQKTLTQAVWKFGDADGKAAANPETQG